MSPAPDVDEVAGQFAWHQENGVDANVLTRTGIARREALSCDSDTAKAILVQRHGRGVSASPLLDLDECDGPSALRDEVHFAACNPCPSCEDSPAVKA